MRCERQAPQHLQPLKIPRHFATARGLTPATWPNSSSGNLYFKTTPCSFLRDPISFPSRAIITGSCWCKELNSCLVGSTVTEFHRWVLLHTPRKDMMPSFLNPLLRKQTFWIFFFAQGSILAVFSSCQGPFQTKILIKPHNFHNAVCIISLN